MSHSLAAQVYADQLRSLRHGEPLWQPEPSKRGEVRIGDVGFVNDGRFHLLFNAIHGPSDESSALPEGFEKLVYDEEYLEDTNERYIPPIPICSSSIVESKLEGEVTAKGVSAAYSFKCKSQKGAIVIPGDYGMLHYVLKNDAFLEYITRHHHSWYELARSRKLSVNPEDIVLVSGWLKTSEWAMAALVNEGSSHALSFSADGCSVAQARFGVERSSDVEMSAFQRSGPGDVTNKIRDQCLFIRYYKAKYRAGPLKFLGMKIVAHAGPHRLDRYHDTEDPAAVLAAAQQDDDDSQPENGIEVVEMPSTQKLQDPLEDMLDFILSTDPTIEIAVGCHEDIFALYPDEWPVDFAASLNALQPVVSLTQNYAGTLFAEPAKLPSLPTPAPTQKSEAAQLSYFPGDLSKPLPSLSLGYSGFGAAKPSYSPAVSGTSSTRSSSPSIIDVLRPGEVVGEELPLQGEVARLVEQNKHHVNVSEEPAKAFEVVRRLGAGSYASVYLVREVSHLEHMGSDSNGREYGREYALRVLSKADLDEEALHAQMLEATIYQSLPSHPNIVTLYRTLETPSYLLLVLEFVPGEDLFYYLEQAHDDLVLLNPSLDRGGRKTAITSERAFTDYLSDGSDAELQEEAEAQAAFRIRMDMEEQEFKAVLEQLQAIADRRPPTSWTGNASSPLNPPPLGIITRPPPTPLLLSTHSQSHLLSRPRLQLIASMFKQMCDAVAACHEHGVYHRDIKPENFIVADAFVESRVPEKEEVRKERSVVVKLTDFGLSTTDMHSTDMDCGSAPYMSYECRNNIHATYMPRAADVWSLGVVLINMLYHYNPWTDTADGVCPSFSLFQQSPVTFFTSRFTGMTQPVAEFLATKVFCILPDPSDDSVRISAKEFGLWAQDLPDLLAPPIRSDNNGLNPTQLASVSVNPAYGVVAIPSSRRPILRIDTDPRTPEIQAPPVGGWNTASVNRQLSVGGFQEAQSENVGGGSGEGAPPPSQDPEEEEGSDLYRVPSLEGRKRGARKGKRKAVPPPPETTENVNETLATASMTLARELSSMSRRPSSSVDKQVHSLIAGLAPPSDATLTKKPSKWKLSFGRSSNSSGSTTPMVASITQELDGMPPAYTSQYAPATIRGRKDASREAVAVGSWRSSISSPPAYDQASSSSHRSYPSLAYQPGLRLRDVSPSRESFMSASTASTDFSSSSKSIRSVSTAATSASSASRRSVAGKSVGSSGRNTSERLPPLPHTPKMLAGKRQGWELSEFPRQVYPNPERTRFSASPSQRRTTMLNNPSLDTISERPHGLSPLSQPRSRTPSASAPTNPTALDSQDTSSHSQEDATGDQRQVQKGQISALAKMLSALRR